MGTLADLKAEEKAMITKIKAEGELKHRLFSFGVRKNAAIQVKALSMNKNTMEIEVGGTGMIALRLEEAREIEVSQ
ncbi:FeoA family protein [Sulfurospirillum arcachonense]|uniref:FeoA family protein n=1 Tax=Sulfurospirillum arcachonense TaxID=57666 RepID=UPI0004696BB0|nr:FeoA family protein [Sulfurospirillum arcachonense]